MRLISIHMENLCWDGVVGRTVRWYIGSDQEQIDFDWWIERFGVSELFWESTSNQWQVPLAYPSLIVVWWTMVERRWDRRYCTILPRWAQGYWKADLEG